MADSAFIYKAQAAQMKYGGSMGGPEFDRMSQRFEKDLGLGNDMESLLSMDRGGLESQVMHLPSRCTSFIALSTHTSRHAEALAALCLALHAPHPSLQCWSILF